MSETVQSYRYLSSSATDVGCVRDLNEDALLERPEIGLWAVADGMGGHDSGDLASQTVIESLFRIEPPLETGGFLRDVQRRIRVAHLALRREAGRRRKASTIGSTVVALLVSDPDFACVWAGDSRLYLLRDGDLQQITRDHSLVQEMVDAGQLDADMAEDHPRANVITRAVGADEDLALETRSDSLRPGDRLMLCSDGLTRYVSDAQIAEILSRSEIADAAPALVRTALENQTRDNVSVIVVACEPKGESDEDLADTLPRANRRTTAQIADLEPGEADQSEAGTSDRGASLTEDAESEAEGDEMLDRILSGRIRDTEAPETGSNAGPVKAQKPGGLGGLFGRFRGPGKD